MCNNTNGDIKTAVHIQQQLLSAALLSWGPMSHLETKCRDPFMN